MARKNAGSPRVVAELGRPETPAETEARKAENSRNYRMRKTVNNLILSLLVTVGLVLVIVLIVPRSDVSHVPKADFVGLSAAAQPAVEQIIAVPELPAGWTSNYAEFRRESGVRSWQMGFLSAKETSFVGVTQGLNGNETWVANLLKNSAATHTEEISGVEWTVYDNRGSAERLGNSAYALTTTAGDSTYVLRGNASDEEFAAIASALAPDIAREAVR